MREIRQSGSEGGAESSSAPTPITEPATSSTLVESSCAGYPLRMTGCFLRAPVRGSQDAAVSAILQACAATYFQPSPPLSQTSV